MKFDYIAKIFIDTKEKTVGKRIFRALKTMKLPVEQKSLIDGDLLIILKDGTKVYIERKSIDDWMGSYNNSHLQNQCLRLSAYEFSCIVIHGKFEDKRKNPTLKHMTKNGYDKQIANIQFFYNIPVFTCNNIREYIFKCLNIAETIHNKKGKILRGSIKEKSTPKTRPDIDILTCGETIGAKKAQLLLDKFGSPKKVLEASPIKLNEVDGVGRVMIGNIKKLRKIYEDGI
jgi:ERCC4-type nuclease